MSGSRDKQGKPLNSEAWGEDHQLAVSKASALSMNPKASKDAVAAANKAVSDTMSGYQQALEAEKKKKGGQPVNTGAASSLFGGLFGQ